MLMLLSLASLSTTNYRYRSSYVMCYSQAVNKSRGLQTWASVLVLHLTVYKSRQRLFGRCMAIS